MTHKDIIIASLEAEIRGLRWAFEQLWAAYAALYNKHHRNKIIIVLFFLCVPPQSADGAAAPGPAASLNEDMAVHCIMGEARGESEEAMTAHGEAFRNRYARYGKIKGVFGCRAKFKEPPHVWEKARRAWRRSATSQLVNGATHWESTDFQLPSWSKGATVTAQYGKTKFYKGVK